MFLYVWSLVLGARVVGPWSRIWFIFYTTEVNHSEWVNTPESHGGTGRPSDPASYLGQTVTFQGKTVNSLLNFGGDLFWNPTWCQRANPTSNWKLATIGVCFGSLHPTHPAVRVIKHARVNYTTFTINNPFTMAIGTSHIASGALDRHLKIQCSKYHMSPPAVLPFEGNHFSATPQSRSTAQCSPLSLTSKNCLCLCSLVLETS